MKVPISFCRLLLTNRGTFANKNSVAFYFTVPSYKSTELNTTALKSNEKNYLRNILSKCRECVLYEPIKKLDVRSIITSSTAQSPSRKPLPKEFTKDELLRKLSNLARTGITPDPNAVDQVQRECFKGYKSWSIEKQLYVMELWHHVPESNPINFIWVARVELLKQFPGLSHDHALQALYYVTWLRQRMSELQRKMLENRFKREINAMTLDEMSIWCLAMFRNHATITNRKLIEDIYAKLLQNDLTKFHEIGLGSVLKMIRFSSTAYQALLMMKLLEKLNWHAKHSDLMLVSQIAFVGAELHIHNPKLLELIVERMVDHVDKMRFKDLERICFVISLFDYKSNATTALLQKISRHLLTVEKYSYFDCVIRCIDYMHRCGVYEPKLINWALDPKTIAEAYSEKNSSNRRELLNIDMFTKINLASKYRGTQLMNSEIVDMVGERIGRSKKKWAHLQQIEEALKDSGRNCVVAHPLPHHSMPNILLVIDTVQKKTIDVTTRMPLQGNLIRASDLTKNQPDSKAVAIILATGSHYLFGMKEYTGHFKYKLQQLDLLGYDEIVISSKEWAAMSGPEQKLCLEKKLSKFGV